MTFSDIVQLTNLILIPILVYVIKLERKLAVLEVTYAEVYRRLTSIDNDINAVHRRMDRFKMPQASSDG